MPRRLVIDLTKDLPHRSKPLSADALSKVFGGCKGEFVACTQNYECCSYKCRKAWYIANANPPYWTYECLPTWATAG
jgi:Mn-containing catalase